MNKNVSIATKLMAAAGFALVIVAIGGGAAYREAEALAQRLVLAEDKVDAVLLLREARRAVDGAGNALRSIESEGIEITRVAYETYFEALDERLDRLARDALASSQQRAAAGLLERLRSADAEVRPVLTDSADLSDTLLAAETFLELAGEVADLENAAAAEARNEMADAVSGARRPVQVIAISVVAMLLLGGLGLFLTIRVAIVRPIVELTHATGRIIEQGDLTQKITVRSDDEIGELAQRFQAMVDRVRTIPAELGPMVEDVTELMDSVGDAMASLNKAARSVNERADDSATRVEATLASLGEVSEHVQTLAAEAQVSGESNRDLARRNITVAESVGKVRRAIEETAGGIAEVTSSARNVATDVTILDASMTETSTSMIEMDAEIRAVDGHARETKELSAVAAQQAASGGAAMSDALTGIAAMGGSVRTATEAMERLGARIGDVSSIVAEISSIADQTTLLALNASIIASQAGEHGRGFAVVANEVKALAARTRESSKGIAEIVDLVQEEAQAAVEVVRDGADSAKRGLELGQQAESALTELRRSAERASQMTGAIATASAEQAKTSSMVTRAVQDVADASSRINGAMTEQAQRSDGLKNLAEQMKALSDGMLASTREQAESSVQISRAIDRIGEVTDGIRDAQQHQQEGSVEVRAALESMRKVAHQQEAEVVAVEIAVEGLRDRGLVLLEAVRKFRY